MNKVAQPHIKCAVRHEPRRLSRLHLSMTHARYHFIFSTNINKVLFQELKSAAVLDWPLIYYDATIRFKVLRALKSGDLRVQWNQIKIDSLPPLPSYAAFCSIFQSWTLYDPAAPPSENKFRHRGRPNQQLPHAESSKFSEIRFLVDPVALANWCAFDKLEPKNPRLYGCSQCYNSEDGEVKFVSALFFRYSEDKTRPPHKRWKLEGWVSTVHFNSHEFRVGDQQESVVGKQKSAAI